MYIVKEPCWLIDEAVPRVEEVYNAKFMGHWAILDKNNCWINSPVDVFYVENPDRSKGHSNYFGLFWSLDSGWSICDAQSAFSVPMMGALCPDGEVLVSRYRHNYVEKDDIMIDGGREYTRTNAENLVSVTVINGEFKYESI